MAGSKSILRGIERCNKRIARANNKKKYSRKPEDIEAAESMIKEQESKKLLLQQQIRFNNVQRDKETKTAKRVSASKQDGQGCNQVGSR